MSPDPIGGDEEGESENATTDTSTTGEHRPLRGGQKLIGDRGKTPGIPDGGDVGACGNRAAAYFRTEALDAVKGHVEDKEGLTPGPPLMLRPSSLAQAARRSAVAFPRAPGE